MAFIIKLIKLYSFINWYIIHFDVGNIYKKANKGYIIERKIVLYYFYY
jgi:hypothetical protein